MSKGSITIIDENKQIRDALRIPLASRGYICGSSVPGSPDEVQEWYGKEKKGDSPSILVIHDASLHDLAREMHEAGEKVLVLADWEIEGCPNVVLGPQTTIQSIVNAIVALTEMRFS